MTNRTPTSKPPDDIEVAVADQLKQRADDQGEGPIQRVVARVAKTLGSTEQLPTWRPGELDGDDATPVAGNGDVASPDQPPASVLATYRRQHQANTAAAVDDISRKVGQLVDLDRRARLYAYDVQHLIGVHALCAKAIDQLADHDLGPPLHCLVVPGTLHFLEKEALVAFAGAPHDL